MAFDFFSQMQRDQQLIDMLTQRIRYCDAFLAALGLLMLSATPARKRRLCRDADLVKQRRQLYEDFRQRLILSNCESRSNLTRSMLNWNFRDSFNNALAFKNNGQYKFLED